MSLTLYKLLLYCFLSCLLYFCFVFACWGAFAFSLQSCSCFLGLGLRYEKVDRENYRGKFGERRVCVLVNESFQVSWKVKMDVIMGVFCF
jgi:hypothetical protein